MLNSSKKIVEIRKSPDFYIRCPENKKHIVGMDVILQCEKA